MVLEISFGDANSGVQVGQNHGHITAQFLQSETSLNQACLRDLRPTNPQDDKDRIKSTNGGLLKDSYCWILDNEEYNQWQNNQSSRLLWIRSDPGKGKTMLLCGIIEELTRSVGDIANICFFFCQATDARINTATAVLRGLIYLVVEKQPSLLSHVRSRYDQAGKVLFEDLNAWNALSRILTDILKDATLQDTYLIIDALDECTTGLPFLLELIVQESPNFPHVKWIVSSRNWPDIEQRLGTATPISLELNEASVSEAVKNFIQYKLHHLATVKKYKAETRDTICRHLLSNSQGTFLWVALVCQDLDRTSRWHALKKLTAFPPGLNALYDRMIGHVRNSEDSELCKRILAVLSIVYRPIALDELTSLIEMPEDLSEDYEALSEMIATCGSFLTLREDTIFFVHNSAKEFLLRKMQNEIFPEGKEAGHYAIFSRSLEVMFKTLRRNIFDIKFPGLPITEVIQPSPNPLATAQYACLYWIDHLRDGWCDRRDKSIFEQEGLVHNFLQQKYLYWLEALSLLGSLSQGIAAMLKLEGMFQRKGKSQVFSHQVRDASRFIRYNKPAIEGSPLQVYSSSLIFSPAQSSTKICYKKEGLDWVLSGPVLERDWSPCLQTLEGHSGSVNSVLWSQDGNRLASASFDHTVRIWEPTTGQCLLASASSDRTVKIWDPASGRCELTLEGHSGSVNSISWSPDGSRLATGSYDKTVRIWDPVTGQSNSMLEGHKDWVMSVAWSQNESRLASASYDKTVKIWNPTTRQCELTFEGHRDWVMSISWSPDGSRLASASSDNTVRIWDPTTGLCVLTLKRHRDWVISIAWSGDGSRLASGSMDNTIRIWDPATGQCQSTLEGHSDSIRSICWYQDGTQLASTSSDHTVRIWDPTTGQCVLTLKGHRDWVISIAWSEDGTRLASGSYDRTVRIWDTTTGQCESNLEGHSDSMRSICWSQDGNRLASTSADRTVRIWDPITGQCTLILKGHNGPINSIALSQDGSRLTSASSDRTVRVWDLATGQCTLILKGHSGPINSIALSQDENRLASGSSDNTVRVWDPATGHCASTLEGHSDWVRSVAWLQDGSRLASASYDKTVKIWDAAIGRCEFTLAGHRSSVNLIAWSQDGSRLASASDDNTVKIWDTTTGRCELTVERHSDSVRSVAWSQNGSLLASASDDNTVNIWNPTTGKCELTLYIRSPFVQFDQVNPSQLHTAIGTFDLGPNGLVTSTAHSTLPEQYGYGLNDECSWINYNGVNILWLPVEYRPASPSLFAISATTVAIGCSSGRVIFLAFSESNPLSGN
ncbi:hypothetical protein N7527_004832 [Penicillium freii]|nr:hypothetical protein N7527_004832 [Penicillium freii]